MKVSGWMLIAASALAGCTPPPPAATGPAPETNPSTPGVPAQSAATAALGIDVYVAGLVDHPHEAVIQEERARRIAADHGVFVAFASFAGLAGGDYAETAGRSGIWSPDGRVIARAGATPGEIARATLRPSP